MIKRIIFAAIFLGLGCVFFLQKQHEKKEALELRKRQEEALVKAHATPLGSDLSSKGAATVKPKPTPILPPAPTAKPRPTPMLPKPTPMLRQSPSCVVPAPMGSSGLALHRSGSQLISPLTRWNGITFPLEQARPCLHFPRRSRRSVSD